MSHSNIGYAPGTFARTLLWPLSTIYASAVLCRNFLYEKRIFKMLTLDHPVISVGNISVGGTGKTPVCIHLASYFKNSGWNPIIISRGYKSTKKLIRKDVPILVSNGQDILLSPQEAGDEPFLMASKLKGVPVLCHKDRYIAGRWAEYHLTGNLFILDDAYQHIKLKRDFNLLLMDANLTLGNPALLPAGPLREPFKNIARADAILITRCPSDKTLIKTIKEKLKKISPSIPIYTSNFVPESLVDQHGNICTFDGKKFSKNIMAFCGIASPGQFFSSLEKIGFKLKYKLAFKDHQKYTLKEIDKILATSSKFKADTLITTEKDLVKLQKFSLNVPIYALTMKIIIHQGNLPGYIASKIRQS